MTSRELERYILKFKSPGLKILHETGISDSCRINVFCEGIEVHD